MLYIEKHFNDEVYDIIILQHSRKQNVSLSHLPCHFIMNAHTFIKIDLL